MTEHIVYLTYLYI